MKADQLQWMATRLAADLTGDQNKKITQWKSFLKETSKNIEHGVKELEQIIHNIDHDPRFQNESIEEGDIRKGSLIEGIKTKIRRLKEVMDSLKEAEKDLTEIYSAMNSLEERIQGEKEATKD